MSLPADCSDEARQNVYREAAAAGTWNDNFGAAPDRLLFDSASTREYESCHREEKPDHDNH